MKQTFVLLMSAVLISGCTLAASGLVRGQGDRVTALFQPGLDGSDAQITLPDGETFRGKMVPTGSSAGFLQQVAPTSPFGDIRYLSDLTSGGMLLGDRGHRMWCSFQSVGFGGEGICDTSDGRIIDIRR
jgi:hypothetical protein